MVLFAEACREDGEAAGGVEGEGVREAVRGVRDSEVHPGRETEIRTREACEIARFTPEEKLKYEHDMMTERDYTDILDTCRAEGLAEGEAKGRAEGKIEGLAEGEAKGKAEGLAEGKMEVARAMKAKGLGMALIAELTGLSEEEIRQS